MRVCLDCHRLTEGTRCVEHERQRERVRGSRTERGYGPAHRALRARYQRRMDAGKTYRCWRCGGTLSGRPDEWQLGHDDQDRKRYRGPECLPCNLATAGRTPPR